MVETARTVLEFIIVVLFGILCKKHFWNRLGNIAKGVFLILFFCILFISFSAASVHVPKRTVSISALDSKNENAKATQVYFKGFDFQGKGPELPETYSGQWIQRDGLLCWYDEGDERYESGITQSVSFIIDIETNQKAVFVGNRWRGIARIQTEQGTVDCDTYYGGEGDADITVALPPPDVGLIVKAVFVPAFVFTVCLFVLFAVAYGILLALLHFAGMIIKNHSGSGILKKFMKYQFLFEELVSRDFKKKYKRTVLGMGWSILSPLLQLFVMRLVFTHFFGRSTEHYTTYLFCGNLVYSYFNESTSQGMTSLMGNSGIFTKVNVPKYLFLLSKNVQTLINFGLTLCVLFLFCVLDSIPFTWKFIFLLYPIATLVLFNLGMGLILSALFVFFRDIQYLWSIFTLLLMYISAIFYNIDVYSPLVQNLFLLNPVYLHIRYFRKIVIESTIPSVWFHILMLADVLTALGIGAWMYKKYNTKFLYYV